MSTFGKQYMFQYEAEFRDTNKRHYLHLETNQAEENNNLLDYTQIDLAAVAAQQQR